MCYDIEKCYLKKNVTEKETGKRAKARFHFELICNLNYIIGFVYFLFKAWAWEI